MITIRDAIDAFIKAKASFIEIQTEFETAWAAPADRAISRMLAQQMKGMPEVNQEELSQLENEIGA